MDNRGVGGFTILELMMVICIAAILSGFAYFGSDLIRREQVSSTTRELLADIQLARINAMNAITQAGKGYGIRFESPTTYVLFQFNDCNDDYTYDTNTCNGAREEANIIKKTLTSFVVLSKTDTSRLISNDLVIFDKFGRPRQANWGMGVMTILVKHSQDESIIKCVSISMNRVRESVWNGSACIY